MFPGFVFRSTKDTVSNIDTNSILFFFKKKIKKISTDSNGLNAETHCGVFVHCLLSKPLLGGYHGGKRVSTQNCQVAPFTWCLDTLAHNSCIFLGDLNSSWHSSPSIF